MKLYITTIFMILSLQLFASEKILLNYQKDISSDFIVGVELILLEDGYTIKTSNCSTDECMEYILKENNISSVVLIKRESSLFNADIINLKTEKREQFDYKFNNEKNFYLIGKNFSKQILSLIKGDKAQNKLKIEKKDIDKTKNKLKIEKKDINKDFKIWITGGVGAAPSIGGFGMDFSINFLRNDNLLFEFRGLISEEFDFFGTKTPNESYSSFSLLAGYSDDTRFTRIKLTTGLSLSNMVLRGKLLSEDDGFWHEEHYEKDESIVVAIPVEFEFMIKYKYIGIGFTVSAELNTKKVMINTMLNLSIGSL